MTTLREKLGLGPKKDENVTHLPADFYAEHERKEAEAEAAAAADAALAGLPTDDLDNEDDEPAVKTEAEVMAEASERLDTLELGEGSWSLIDRALDSMSRNTGAGLTDPDAIADAKGRAALVRMADNDLSVVVAALIQSSTPTDAPGVVYSMLYKVLSQALYFANLDFRQAEGMDVYSDEATVEEFFTRYVSSTYVDEALSRVVDDRVLSADDQREHDADEEARSNMGFEPRRDAQLRYLSEKYNAEDPGSAVVQALTDIQLYFQLTTESLGWDITRPMPFANTMEADGVTFTPITDAMTAIDVTEIKRKAAQVKRREKRAAQLGAAQQAAQAILLAKMTRPTVHRLPKK